MYKFVIWNVTTISPSPKQIDLYPSTLNFKIFYKQHPCSNTIFEWRIKICKIPRTIFLTKCLLIRCNEWSNALHHSITNLLGNYFELPKCLIKCEFFNHKLFYPIHPWFFGKVSVINMNFDLLHDFNHHYSSMVVW